MNKGSTAEDRRDPTSDFELILKPLEPFIQHEAMRTLQSIVSRDLLDLETDEVVQRVRIQLWYALQRTAIEKPKAYVRRMVRNEVLQLIRRNKSTTPLLLDHDGELFQGNPLSIGTRAEDPAEQVEEDFTATHSLESVLDAINEFPPRQRDAMLMSMKESVDDILGLQKACEVRHIELECINWPEDQKAKLLLRASLSVGRRRLREQLHSSHKTLF
jgi:RNA polymerase sigma factor (sigma-70 family)